MGQAVGCELSGLGASFKAGGSKVGSKVKVVRRRMPPLSPEVVLSPTWPLLSHKHVDDRPWMPVAQMSL